MSMRPCVWMEGSEVHFIDQRYLPHEDKLYIARTTEEVAYAISDMVVRGAPAIGVAAAYGMAQAAMINDGGLPEAGEQLKATRPTAHDLFFAVDHMITAIKDGQGPDAASKDYADSITERCERIGIHGEQLVPYDGRILTHCNAGALATVLWGTALSPIYKAFEAGKDPFVYVDETRPRLQGARLTAYELHDAGVRCSIISDNAAGHYMLRGEVDLCIVGADRISRNGDVANKIGTYEKAVVARDNDIPFYVAAPTSTYDPSLADGLAIPIEERSQDEVLIVRGNPIGPKGVGALNPAFDVTPARLVTGYITEHGVLAADELESRLADF